MRNHVYSDERTAEAATCLAELLVDLEYESGRTTGQTLETWRRWVDTVEERLIEHDRLLEVIGDIVKGAHLGTVSPPRQVPSTLDDTKPHTRSAK